MKRILITGENSFIGNSFESWINKGYSDKYSITKISLRGKTISEVDFSGYDVVLCVTGIAHADTNKNNKAQEELYYSINTELTYSSAQKAKADGVGQFIFLSSIIVYGNSAAIGERKLISRETKEAPDGFYGESKARADVKLLKLNDNRFKVASIRPPMIYGRGSKGNYPKLAKMAGILPFFPDIDNERSMLYIDNLSEFIRLIIEEEKSGLFYPQNKEYVKTSELVQEIARVKGKKVRLTKLFNPMLRLLSSRIGLINKVFGSLAYDKALSDTFDYRYCIFNLRESIEQTEKTTDKK